MRKCGACKKPIRWDESLSTCLLVGPGGEGYYQACPRCISDHEGTAPPPAPVYPPGRVPPHPTRPDDYLPICGLCREALYEGERCSHVRVEAEDVEGAGVEPGAYEMCPRCQSRWRPIVLARWRRDGACGRHDNPGRLL